MKLTNEELNDIWNDLAVADKKNILEKVYKNKFTIQYLANLEFYQISGPNRKKVINIIQYYYDIGGGF